MEEMDLFRNRAVEDETLKEVVVRFANHLSFILLRTGHCIMSHNIA